MEKEDLKTNIPTEEDTDIIKDVEDKRTSTEKIKDLETEKPVRERRERTPREPRERTVREPRERKERVQMETTEEISVKENEDTKAEAEKPVRERRERTPREPRERTVREPRERRERTPRETTEETETKTERPSRERSERPERAGRSRRGKEEPSLKLFVGSSPHLRSEQTIQTVMRDVVIALIPTLLAGIYFFGLRALLVTLVSVLFAVGSEYVYERLTKKEITVTDFSAVVTGMLLAYNVPVTIPYWMIAIASIFAIIVVKQLYGGIGMNFMNPALAARAALMASFPTAMANYVMPNISISNFLNSTTYSNIVDATTFATPLSKGTEVNILEAFIGIRGGCIGEVSTLCLLIGAGYLLYRKVISLRIPVIFILSTAVVLVLTGTEISKLPVQLLMGGLILGAFFMATDYVSAPVNRKAQIFFAIGCGIVTALIRNLGALPEGVSYSILFMNIFTPLLEKYCIPKVFGEGRVKK